MISYTLKTDCKNIMEVCLLMLSLRGIMLFFFQDMHVLWNESDVFKFPFAHMYLDSGPALPFSSLEL